MMNQQKICMNFFFDVFGTDVSVETEHGGVVYQQTSIKSCFGGNIDEGMIKDINNLINKVPPPGNMYLRYRQIGISKIQGGNPELGFNKMQQRIESFSGAPAPIRFKTIPIWEAVPENMKQRRNWVNNALKDYIENKRFNVDKIMKEVQEARNKDFLGPIKVHLVDFQQGQKARMVTHWRGAPVVQLKDHNYVPVFFMRKETIELKAGERKNTGHFLYERKDGNNYDRIRFSSFVERNKEGQIRTFVNVGENRDEELYSSAWHGKKCEFSPFGPQWCRDKIGCIQVNHLLKRGACMDCLPVFEDKPAEHNLKHRFLNGCDCSEF